MDRFAEFSFSAPACRINIAEGPDNGPDLVLLHGATSWWRSWEPVLPELSRHFHVFALDTRGSGKSDRTPGRYAVMDMAGDVAAFLETLSSPAHLIGHSFGGHVALALSALQRELIAAMVIEDIPLSLDGDKLKARDAGPGFAAWLKILAREPDTETILRAVQRTDLKLSPERQRARAKSLSLLDPQVLEVYVNGAPFEGYDPHALFAGLTLPTLLVEADPSVDTRMEQGTGERAAALSPHLQRATIQGAGHNVHGEDPQAFLAAVLGFFRSLRS